MGFLYRREGEHDVKVPARYEPILSLIGEGEENATTVSDISKLTGFSNEMIRHVVSVCVTQYGIGIATSPRGYYFIQTTEEQIASYRNLRSRARKLLIRAKAIRNLPAQGQQEIEFDETIA